MFCMAWFMELSRLSNSLGSVCSQRRGPAGGCSGPSPAPSLFQPSLPSISLPLESLEHFPPRARVPSCSWPRRAVVLACPERLSRRPSDRGPTAERAPGPTPSLSVGCLACSHFLPHLPPIKPPAWGGAVAWSLASLATASPAVCSYILHSAQAWRVQDPTRGFGQ